MRGNPKTIGLICGHGELPHKLIQKLSSENHPFVTIGFEGMIEPELFTEITVFPVGDIGKILKHFHDHHVTHIVMAGTMQRPSLTSLSLDATGAKWLAKLGMAAFRGDDALLKKLMELMQEEGFEILSPQDILPHLLIQKGLLTQTPPCPQAVMDMELGQKILDTLSPFDIGQAIVIQQGLVLGIEAIEGTAELLARVIPLKREGFGGVLVKLAKKDQSLKVDIPTIGLDTAKQAHNANLAGIVISASTSQVLNAEEVINYLDEHNLFLLAIE